MKVKVGNRLIPEEELFERAKTYKPKFPQTVMAVQIISPFEIKYSSGEVVKGAPLDYLVVNEKGELGIIDKGVFEASYEEV